MVVEIVIAESHPLHIVLTVEQTIVAVFVGSTTIEEFTVVNPDMSTPVGLGTYLISLDSDAVRVAHFYLCTITPSHNLIFTSSEHRNTLHGETAVTDDDVINRLHHEGDMRKKRSLTCCRIHHTNQSLVRSNHNALAIDRLHARLTTLVVKQMTGTQIIHIALDACSNIMIYDNDIWICCLEIGLQLREVISLHHLATSTTGSTTSTIPIRASHTFVGSKAIQREVTTILCLCICHHREATEQSRSQESFTTNSLKLCRNGRVNLFHCRISFCLICSFEKKGCPHHEKTALSLFHFIYLSSLRKTCLLFCYRYKFDEI